MLGASLGSIFSFLRSDSVVEGGVWAKKVSFINQIHSKEVRTINE